MKDKIRHYCQSKQNEIENITEVRELDSIKRNVLMKLCSYRSIVKNIEQKNRRMTNKEFVETFKIIKLDVSQYYYSITQQLVSKRRQLDEKGLTPKRIQKFQVFEADESLVGDRCAVCLGDIETGRKMMRLDCDGQHEFCQSCTEKWFADYKTCPCCRHSF